MKGKHLVTKQRWTMQQVSEFPFEVDGAGSDDIMCGYKLANEVWGKERADDSNSALLAFAYLWRRFGPPFQGCDDHKDLSAYTLTTPDPDVFLFLRSSGSGLACSVGYRANVVIREKFNAPIVRWERKFERWFLEKNPGLIEKRGQAAANKRYSAWRFNQKKIEAAEKEIGTFPSFRRADNSKHPVVKRVNGALRAAMLELLRPVYVRDCPLNLFGRLTDSEASKIGKEVKPSKYAGYPVPIEAMDAMIAEDKAEQTSTNNV